MLKVDNGEVLPENPKIPPKWDHREGEMNIVLVCITNHHNNGVTLERRINIETCERVERITVQSADFLKKHQGIFLK